MQCSMEEEQENSQQQVQLWEISLMSHVIFSSIAQEESIVHATKDLPIKKITEIESKYFMRLLVDDKPGVLARIADTLGRIK